MYVTLDTSSFNSLVIRPKRKGSRRTPLKFGTRIDGALREGRLYIVMDAGGGLLGEWGNTSSYELARVLFTTWKDWKAIKAVDASPPIPQPHKRHFETNQWLRDGGDRLVIRIALQSPERKVVAEDSDFWDPGKPRERGNANAPVCRYLRTKLNIDVMRIGELVAQSES